MVLVGLGNGSLVEHDHVILAFNHFAKRDIFRSDEKLVCIGVFRDFGWASLDEADARLTGTIVELFVTLGRCANVDVIN